MREEDARFQEELFVLLEWHACMALEQARHEGSVSELSVLERQGGWVPLDEQVGQRIGHG